MLVSLMASDVLLHGPNELVPARSNYNADGLLLAPLLEARQCVSEVHGALLLHSTFLQRWLTWRRFEGHAGDRSHCVPYGVPYVYEYVLQTSVTDEDYLNRLDTGPAVWSLLIQSHAGASGSSIKWYVAPYSWWCQH